MLSVRDRTPAQDPREQQRTYPYMALHIFFAIFDDALRLRDEFAMIGKTVSLDDREDWKERIAD